MPQPNLICTVILGVLLFFSGAIPLFWQTLVSGFDLIPGDLGDTRFNHYLLEHSWRWLASYELHSVFWDAPFYYPTQNVMAFSDTLLSVAPLYWLPRVVGLSPHASYLTWIASVLLLNYLSFYALLRVHTKCTAVASLVAAFLFSFASVRTAQIGHPQLLPQFYSILCLHCVLLAKKRDPYLLLSLAALSYALQWYASFYLAWLLGVVIGVLLVFLLCVRAGRMYLVEYVSERFFALCFAAVVFLLSVTPLVREYWLVSQLVGLRSSAEIASFTPEWPMLLYYGAGHLLYGGLLEAYHDAFAVHEHQLGIGLITSVLALYGLWLIPHVAVRFALLATLICVGAITFSFWPQLAAFVPGGGAIRVIGRVMLVLLAVVSLGVAYVLSMLQRSSISFRWRSVGMFVLIAVIVLEQLRVPESYSLREYRVPVGILREAMTTAPKNCKVFYYASTAGTLPPWKYQLDVMWAGMLAEVPVINGYSGNSPPEWELDESRIHGGEDRARLYEALSHWVATQQLSSTAVCWLLPNPERSSNVPLRAYSLAEL